MERTRPHLSPVFRVAEPLADIPEGPPEDAGRVLGRAGAEDLRGLGYVGYTMGEAVLPEFVQLDPPASSSRG